MDFFAVVVGVAMVVAAIVAMVVVAYASASAFFVAIAAVVNYKNFPVVSSRTAHILYDCSVAVETGLLCSAGCGEKQIYSWR